MLYRITLFVDVSEVWPAARLRRTCLISYCYIAYLSGQLLSWHPSKLGRRRRNYSTRFNILYTIHSQQNLHCVLTACRVIRTLQFHYLDVVHYEPIESSVIFPFKIVLRI